ncbi:hypothetical protein Dimus_016233 [Dionaea muscipula]
MLGEGVVLGWLLDAHRARPACGLILHDFQPKKRELGTWPVPSLGIGKMSLASIHDLHGLPPSSMAGRGSLVSSCSALISSISLAAVVLIWSRNPDFMHVAGNDQLPQLHAQVFECGKGSASWARRFEGKEESSTSLDELHELDLMVLLEPGAGLFLTPDTGLMHGLLFGISHVDLVLLHPWLLSGLSWSSAMLSRSYARPFVLSSAATCS